MLTPQFNGLLLGEAQALIELGAVLGQSPLLLADQYLLLLWSDPCLLH